MSLGIRAKLLGSFGIVLLLLAGVAAFGLIKLSAGQADIADLGNTQLQGVQTVLDVKVQALSMQRDIRQALLVTGPAATTAKADYDADETRLAADVARLGPLLQTAEGQARLADLARADAAWKPMRMQMMALAMVGNTAEAQTMMASPANAQTLAALNSALDALIQVKGTRVGSVVTASAASGQQSLQIMVGFTVVTILIGLGVAFWLARGITGGVRQVQTTLTSMADNCAAYLEDGLGAMANNDLTVDVRAVTQPIERYGSDEIGQTAAVTNKMLSKLRATIESYGTARAGLTALISQVQAAGIGLADTSAQLGSAASQTGAAVQQVTMAVQNVASGAQETSRSAQETTAAVTQLSQVIDGIARGATDQARQVQSTSHTTTQMAADIDEVAANATQMANASQQTRAAAEQGGQAVRDTTAAMDEIQQVVGQAASKVRELGTLSQKIGAVVETIDDIAEQTNLLALNAAIEAARAGEHGKGFAVVADEVRKLAERSGRETKQIAQLIAEVQTGTKEAVSAMDVGAAKVQLGSEKANQAGQALEEILKAVQDTVRQVGEIASASQQMSGGARSVTDAMQSISAVVEESSAATEQMAAQASAVTGSIQSIAAVSQEQSAATEEVSASTEQMSAQVEQMSAQAQELATTAEHLKSLVSRFKLDGDTTSSAVSRPVTTTGKVVPLRRAA